MWRPDKEAWNKRLDFFLIRRLKFVEQRLKMRYSVGQEQFDVYERNMINCGADLMLTSLAEEMENMNDDQKLIFVENNIKKRRMD